MIFVIRLFVSFTFFFSLPLPLNLWSSYRGCAIRQQQRLEALRLSFYTSRSLIMSGIFCGLPPSVCLYYKIFLSQLLFVMVGLPVASAVCQKSLPSAHPSLQELRLVCHDAKVSSCKGPCARGPQSIIVVGDYQI